MKKKLALLLALALVAALLTGCMGGAPAKNANEITVFADASLEKALTEVAVAYTGGDEPVAAKGTEILFGFDSSDALKTKIESGAYCDVFISAGQDQMDALDKSKPEVNKKGIDLVISTSRFDILENRIVLVVPAGNPKGITSFDDLSGDKLSLLAVGNADVPVGQYAAELLTNLGIYDRLEGEGKFAFCASTAEVTTQVIEGAADCGIVYATDVLSLSDPSKLEVVAPAAEDAVSRAIYPAAMINVSENQAAAQAFLDYLKSDAAKAIFKKYGFTVLY